MYSYEIEQYLRERNYLLNGDEILFITDLRRNPQLDHISFKEDYYEMWTNDGWYFRFGIKPYIRSLRKP